MALAPLLYNITFDSQTRILYFWDKAGHEIYHCEIPSPAPALPTVSIRGDFGDYNWFQFTSSSVSNYSFEEGVITSVYKYATGGEYGDWDSSKCYAVLVYRDTGATYEGRVGIEPVNINDNVYMHNISGSTISVALVRIAVCSSSLATVITVYDSSNNPYNAFKYTSDGTDYYYVLDGTQADWTDDLSTIGYHVLSVAYLDIQDKYVFWKVWVWLFEDNSASRHISFDSNKRYIFDSAYTVNGSKVNLKSHTITIGRPDSTTEILGLIDSYSGFTAYKIYYHAIPNS